LPHSPVDVLRPPSLPCPMPAQDFWFWSGRPAADGAHATAAGWWRRAVVLGLALLLTALFAWKLYQVLSFQRLTPVQTIFLVLCTICFAWVALGSVSALLGFLALRSGAHPDTIRLPEHEVTLAERTALLFPVYHEDPARVAATAEAMAEELIELAAAKAFDIFVLSDSRTEEAARTEARARSCSAGCSRRRHPAGRPAWVAFGLPAPCCSRRCSRCCSRRS
jgi:membrane glycosyltransferase